MEMDLTALKRKWLKKHLQELRATKDKEEEKGGMLGFIGILCTLLPLLTAAVYFVGMRYYQGYLGQFRLESTEFSPSTDITLFTGFYLLLQLLLPYVVPVIATLGTLFLALFAMLFTVRWRLTLSWWAIRFFVLTPLVLKGGKIANNYPAPLTFNIMIWLQSSIFKLAIFIVPPLLVIMASEHLKPMGEKLAQKQIDQLEQGKWPQTEAHSQSPLLGDEPHIRIACNTSHCAYRLKGGDTLILRFDQIEETRYRPDKAASK
ncbi:hypothetical protein [Aeromonas dhakensis]|uniref:hypothetical protein n=1 Tax=Aeromonas dhakensis TaxID=196024 RepID=UPI00198073E4|nr:hypothetical protein [Aeromonas dhakensis]MBW3732071.1 hypothetical protein [Aeromonas dhakensis]QSR56659.1 hypothetical protein GO601_15165 [Aeromonas dhakensis]